MHLVIQRPAKLGWHHTQDNNFELSITRGDTAETVKRKLEDHHGLPADSHSLLYNGKVLSSSKPLLQYGIDKGSVLELAPFEPSPTLTPSSSPMLSSPEHELFEGWQKARAGLAKGFAPRLATAGTGGSSAAHFLTYHASVPCRHCFSTSISIVLVLHVMSMPYRLLCQRSINMKQKPIGHRASD